jgi:hypothetical protein
MNGISIPFSSTPFAWRMKNPYAGNIQNMDGSGYSLSRSGVSYGSRGGTPPPPAAAAASMPRRVCFASQNEPRVTQYATSSFRRDERPREDRASAGCRPDVTASTRAWIATTVGRPPFRQLRPIARRSRSPRTQIDRWYPGREKYCSSARRGAAARRPVRPRSGYAGARIRPDGPGSTTF